MRAPLFKTIPDKHHGVDLALGGLPERVIQHPADLCIAGPAANPGHQSRQSHRIADPARGFTLRIKALRAAIIDQLHVDPAEQSGLLEHLDLQLGRAVPRLLARSRSVDRKDQTAALRLRLLLLLAGKVGEKGINP